MTPDEALSFIHSTSWLGSRPGLERTRELLARLGDPQRNLNFIHIAGTNGKGSAAAMLASVLTAAGYATGLYTSPHLWSFNERMTADSVRITDGEIAELAEELEPHVCAMAAPPTEFELITAMALLWFAKRRCDVVVLEAGMGGRLDSTNVIDAPLCSVITSIGLDHTRELGPTLTDIAREKAGIIKPGCPTVLYAAPEAVTAVIAEVCAERGSPLTVTDFDALSPLSDTIDGQTFRYKDGPVLRLPLLGAHQLKNAATALDALSVLPFTVPDMAVASGLATVQWPARFEIVARKPYVVVDGGHNVQCVETIAAAIRAYFPDSKPVFIVGVLNDKDYRAMTKILAPLAKAFVAVEPRSSRAVPAHILAETLAKWNRPVVTVPNIAAGIEYASSVAGEDGAVVALGSLYMAGDIRNHFGLS